MRPSSVFSGFSVLSGPEVDGSAGFSDVDRFFIAGAMELVNSFAFAGRRPAFVF